MLMPLFQLEKKKQEYEMAAEQRKQFQAQLQMYAQQDAREKEEIEHLTRDLQRAGVSQSNTERTFASEPSTPPDRESTFSSVFSRSNRYSTSSFTSPPANTRSSRSNSQIASPPSGFTNIPQHGSTDGLPSRSVPSSRRGSTDRVTAFVPETAGSARRNGGPANRYSMPVTGARGRTYDPVPENSPAIEMEHVNTTSFLFDDDEKSKDALASPEVQKYLQMSDNNFPVLIRQNEDSGRLSASSAALDLAFGRSNDFVEPNDLPRGHRLSLQHNLQSSNASQLGPQGNGFSGAHSEQSLETVKPFQNRHSMEVASSALSNPQTSLQTLSSDAGRPSLANSHASYSTSDVPTLKNANGTTNNFPMQNPSQQFHNHNASLGRIPQHAINSRHSRELSASTDAQREDNAYQPLSAALQSTSPSGATPATTASPVDSLSTPTGVFNGMNLNNQPFYAGYGMQLMNMGLNPMMANPLAFQNQMQLLQQQNSFLPYTNYAQQSRFQDGHPRSMQTRRVAHTDDQTRFNNVKLETLRGEILSLCKDQHGCRYLQKKLEDRSSPDNVMIIFVEVYQHVVELMTDPFGNYLCQKLLEYANDEQRSMLVKSAAPDMVKIALNSHGTRALQKMIEFIGTPEQIQTIIQALDGRVVELIQDLNGNHVIQKCLNHLSPTDAQFIFSAVGENCVVVGTHRHGCCVLQRCIDHASGSQKAHLINQITEHAFHLVQDPFGNYVLQYIIDLQEACFTDPLCATFRGQIPQLSKQKFSSNVIEKCLRGADPTVTRSLIEEMFNTNELDKMLRDSYANYVVQTAMDYADHDTKARLVESIRPLLPAVRHTPHGRRISTKIMTMDGQGRFSGNGTPTDRTAGQIPLSLQMTPSSGSASQGAAMNGYGNQMQNPMSAFPNQYSQFSSTHSANMHNGPTYSPFGNENLPNVQQPAPFTRIGNFF